MARPAGELIFQWDTSKALNATQAAIAAAMRRVAQEAEESIRRKVSTPYPPASRPGAYPHLRTGEFEAGITVTGTVNGIKVYSEAPYGGYLDQGTDKMAPRPWAGRGVMALNPNLKLIKYASEHMERTGYGPKGRRK